MREFFRRLSNKLDSGLANAQEEKRVALEQNRQAQIELANTIEETNEKIRRYEEDLPSIIAEDDRRFKEELAAEKAAREARKTQREKLLDEAKKGRE